MVAHDSGLLPKNSLRFVRFYVGSLTLPAQFEGCVEVEVFIAFARSPIHYW